MIIHIRLENLPKEYQEKLRSRKLTQQTICSLAHSVSKKYRQQKRVLLRIAAVSFPAILVMALMGIFSPAASKGNRSVIIFSCFAAWVMIQVILIGIYQIAVARVPRQFVRCLRQGYPELAMVYGYETIRNGYLEASSSFRKYPFFMCIEDVMEIRNSSDMVVVGFAHGLINRNQSVFLLPREGDGKEKKAAIVSGIEIGPGQPAVRALDCHAALRIRDGKEMNLCAGMCLVADHLL